MIDKSFIQRIEELTEIRIHEIHGRQYAERGLVLIPKEPRPESLVLNTLTGLVDYLKSGIDALGIAMVRIVRYDCVEVMSDYGGDDAGRSIYIKAILDPALQGYPFGQWLDPETFIIALQAQFQETPDKARILEIVGNMKAERVKNYADDGTTQTVAVRAGVALAENTMVPNPVSLKPYRTFREIDQPPSNFVFRVRDGKENEPPRCALFEADGGFWRLSAIERIRDWLQERLPEVTIIA